MKNSDVAESFAVKSHPEGKRFGTANLFIVGQTIYSYGTHFKIAEKRDNVVAVTTEKYSQSTSKHTNSVLRALERQGWNIIREVL